MNHNCALFAAMFAHLSEADKRTSITDTGMSDASHRHQAEYLMLTEKEERELESDVCTN